MFVLAILFFLFLSSSTAAAVELEGVGGWEGDSHQSGFAFYGLSGTYPLRDHLALLGKIEANDLYYQYGSSDDLTRVHSPGIRLMSGVKVQLKTTMILLSAGMEQRWNQTIESSQTATI